MHGWLCQICLGEMNDYKMAGRIHSVAIYYCSPVTVRVKRTREMVRVRLFICLVFIIVIISFMLGFYNYS